MTHKIIGSGLMVLALLGASVYGQEPGANQTTVTVPRIIRYTGESPKSLENSSTEILEITFAIYGEEFAGTPLWREVQSVRVNNEGKYVVELGNATQGGLPGDLFNGRESRWLGVQVNGEQEQPRELFLSVPYAILAGDAQTLGGLPASAYVQVAQPMAAGASVAAAGVSPATAKTVTTAGGTVNRLAKFDSTVDISSSQIVDTGTNVGIGNTAPAAKLDVSGSGIFRGSLALPSTAAATAAAGKSSSTLSLTGSAFNSSTKAATNQTFSWRVDPVGNNTAAPSGKLNLLYGTTSTGFGISNKGIVSFAAGQTFPHVSSTGAESITLTAPPEFTVTGSPVNGTGTLALNWKVAPSTQSVAGAMVKRDASGNINAFALSANEFQANTLSLTSDFVDSAILTIENGSSGGNTNALLAHNQSSGGAAVMGQATGGGIGVQGLAPFSGAASGQGVWGESSGTQFSSDGFGPDGVDGIAHSPAGSGVVAINTAGGTGLFASSPEPGLAGRFVGDVLITGRLTKAGGSFKIDHPLDPANKYLSHSFVESPDMMNIYNGDVTTDVRGNATIQLPDYFEALNRDFRYQLAVIGQFAEAIVASEVTHNQFAIKTDKPNVRVSWQVTGIRHDAWAEAHRIQVEEQKVDEERGHFLHPELFGADEDSSVAAVHHPGAMKMMKAAREGKPILPVQPPIGRPVRKPILTAKPVTATAVSNTNR